METAVSAESEQHLQTESLIPMKKRAQDFRRLRSVPDDSAASMSSADMPDISELTVSGSKSDCAYLSLQRARMDFRLVASLSSARYEDLLARGWRRFGRTLFRPACPVCNACRSLRIVLPAFRASRSQRRCLRRNADVRVILQRPTLTSRHLEIYNDYHQDMHKCRGWCF